MSSANGAGGDGYDVRLLASVPLATRAEKQEGYDLNLLENAHRTTAPPPPPPKPFESLASQRKLEPESLGASVSYLSSQSATHQRTTVPWWRQRKWVIVLVVGFLLCIAAIIGGAVGGTSGHGSSHHNGAQLVGNNSTDEAPAPSNSSISPGQSSSSLSSGQPSPSIPPDQSNSSITTSSGASDGIARKSLFQPFLGPQSAPAPTSNEP